MKRDKVIYNNMSPIIQIASWFIIMIPLSSAHIYVSGTMYDNSWTIMWAIMDLFFFHLITLLLMNTPIVIRENGISIPLAPTNYFKRTIFFKVNEIDSIVYNGTMFQVRREDGFHRSFKRNKFPFNTLLLKNIEKYCKDNDIKYVRKTKDLLGREIIMER